MESKVEGKVEGKVERRRSASDSLVRLGASLSSSVIRGRRLVILCYHRVLPAPDPLLPDTVDKDIFDVHMDVLSRSFRPMLLNEAVRQLYAGRLPRRAVCVTFDDGYSDNYQVALPILKKYGIPATIFVATTYLDGGRMWNDTVIESIRRATVDSFDLPGIDLPAMPLSNDTERALAARSIVLSLRRLPLEERMEKTAELARSVGANLPKDLMLSTSQLVQMHKMGIEIGAHTATHPILSRLSREVAQGEIRDSIAHLRETLDTEIHGFAYPNGHPGVDFDKSHVEMVRKEGLAYAVTTARGSCSISTDRYQLPRLDPWDTDPLKFGARLVVEFAVRPSRIV